MVKLFKLCLSNVCGNQKLWGCMFVFKPSSSFACVIKSNMKVWMLLLLRAIPIM